MSIPLDGLTGVVGETGDILLHTMVGRATRVYNNKGEIVVATVVPCGTHMVASITCLSGIVVVYTNMSGAKELTKDGIIHRQGPRITTTPKKHRVYDDAIHLGMESGKSYLAGDFKSLCTDFSIFSTKRALIHSVLCGFLEIAGTYPYDIYEPFTSIQLPNFACEDFQILLTCAGIDHNISEVRKSTIPGQSVIQFDIPWAELYILDQDYNNFIREKEDVGQNLHTDITDFRLAHTSDQCTLYTVHTKNEDIVVLDNSILLKTTLIPGKKMN